MSALPEAFLERLRRIVPPDAFDEVVAGFGRPQAVGFRVNPFRADAEAVVEELRREGLHPEAVEGLPGGFWVPPEERDALLTSSAGAEDQIYVQDLASQVPPVLLAPESGERVLDMCAAPGSKTGQLAALMQGEGELAAVELVRGRFFKLRANLERQGVRDVRTFNRDGTTVWRHRPEYFDRILVDAPCSTEGQLRADDPASAQYWSPRKVKEMSRKQGRLLFSAIQSLRVGGTLVYSTCTFAPEENEGTLTRMLERFDDALEVVPVQLPPLFEAQPPLESWGRDTFHPSVRHARRLLPTPYSEAFFVAKLVKRRPTLDA